MWHQQHPSASHIDDPDLLSDCASGHPPARYPHGIPQHPVVGYSEEQHQQWKAGKGQDSVKGYSDSGKCLYESGRTDSGFLSGPNIVSETITDEPSSSTSSRKIREDPLPEESPEESKSLMRLDSGVDVGLNDQFSSLSLKNNSLNDLNNVSSTKSQSQDSSSPFTNINLPSSHTSQKIPTTPQSPTSTPQQQSAEQLHTIQPWELYYQQDEDGDTQLHIAIIQGFIEVVYSLILMAPHQCFLDILNDVYQTPLHLAVLTHQPRIVRQLLVAGAMVDIRDQNGNTPLHLACQSGDLECVKALTEPVTIQETSTANLQYTAYQQQVPQNLEERNYDGQMCIHLAAISGKVEVLRHLLWFGANVNARDGKSGRTALHYSVEMSLHQVTHFLLEECAPGLLLEAPTYAGFTAYQLAICLDSALARQLADGGALPRDLPDDETDSDSDLSDDEQMYQKPLDDNFSGLRVNGQPINISA